MPSTLTYPGVYIEELASRVHTITGVSTSVAAFLARATKGPINKAVRILSLADFERNFGDPDSNSELSTAVRLFLLQKATAFDALSFPVFSSGMRSAVAIIGAIVLGLLASVLAYRADAKPS